MNFLVFNIFQAVVQVIIMALAPEEHNTIGE